MRVDLTGQKFNMLTVIEHANDINGREAYLCKCDCGNTAIVEARRLKSRTTKSCGCLRNKWKRGLVQKPNTYEFVDDYVIGTDPKGNKFYFDKTDYELLSKYKWNVHQYGYVRAKVWLDDESSQLVYMHRLIMSFPEDMDVDHINHKRYDNRRSNLRVIPHSENMKNTTRSDDVIIRKYCIKGHEELGYFNTKQEAINAYQVIVYQKN